MKLLISLSALIIASGPLYSQFDSFSELYQKADSLEKAEQFIEAKRIVVDNWNNFPESWFELSKELIYINSKLENFQANLTIFNEGHRRGFFYLIHPAMKQFKPYDSLPGFDTITRNDQLLRKTALEKSSTIYETELPSGHNKDSVYPLCIIFHGGGSNIERVKKHWHSNLLDSLFIKVYLQSYRHYDSKTYGWRSGDNRADKELNNILTELNQQYNIDSTSVVLMGISAGGTYATDVAVRNVIPVKGIITFCSGLPRNLANNVQTEKNWPDISGFVVGGEKDFYLSQQKKLVELFKENGRQINHIVVENMEHSYPENEAGYINAGLEFLQIIKN